MQLTLTRRTEYRVAVELYDDNGQVIYQSLLNRFKDKDVQWLARMFGYSIAETTQQLNSVCEVETDGEWSPAVHEVQPPQSLLDAITRVEGAGERAVEDAGVFTVSVREIQQPIQFAQSFVDPEPGEALREAFRATATGMVEPLVEWTDKSKLCCLDVDYHDLPFAKRPRYKDLRVTVSRIRPQPFCWHASHRGGAKLYYVAKPGYTAEELAAIAGLSWRRVDPRATFDLIKASRHPMYRRTRDQSPAPVIKDDEICYCHGGADPGELRRLLAAEMTQEEVAEFLADRGWTIGQTLPHAECPISPTGDHKENVYVGDRGVYCHRCNALGLGPRGSGFLPYATLAGGSDPLMAQLVKGFCHFEHAAVILSSTFPGVSQSVLEIVYRVMLKIVHTPEDPRISLAMTAGRGFVRTAGMWVTADGTSDLKQGLKEFARSLPAVMVPGEKGYGLNVPKYTAFLNSGSLEEYGYPDVTFIRGCRVYSHHLTGRTQEHVRVIIRPEFRDCQPKYLSREKRMGQEDAWGLLESEYPGIDRGYVKLLIAAKGASEGRLAQCPFVLVTGPAGSGKSTTPHIVAGICGDKADEPIWHPHPERFRAALMDAAKQSSFVVINEVFKSADMNRIPHVQALNPMLSLTEDSRSHVLYVGSVPFGRLPVFVLTDVTVPREVETDIQIARRFVYYRLSKRIHWESTFLDRGIRSHEFRLISSEHALAADSILSEVVDTYFSEPRSLRDIAESVGAHSLETYSDDGDRKVSLMKELYNAVIAAPAVTGSDAMRYAPNRGWKRIDKTNGRLNEIWAELCDGNTPDQWVSSRTCAAEDWAKILGLDFPIVCDTKPYQTSVVYIRFRSANDPKKPAWINGKKVAK